MRLSRIFVEQPLAVGLKIQLDTAASHYIRNVLRLKSDTLVLLFNGEEQIDFNASLGLEGKNTFATITNTNSQTSESTLKTEIIQGLSRNDHLDWMIQKATELGVHKISIFNAEHSQIPIKASNLNKKLLHWRAISIKACEQSGRHQPPQIEFNYDLQKTLVDVKNREGLFLLNFSGRHLKSHLMSSDNRFPISILLGPEGGLSKTEINRALEKGFVSAQLGPRILRTETAAITALALTQAIKGDI